MAATERRVSSSRRGMTVLGKVPVVPKPMNLPSQRLENRGLFPDVDIVPRGTCSWGSAGQFPGASGRKSVKSDAAASTPLKSGGECENGGKVESQPVSSTSSRNSGVKDGGGLLGTSIQFSSSAKASTDQALDRKIAEPRNSNSYNCDCLDSQKQETTETLLQTSGDGYTRGGSVPPGFGNSGPQGNQSRAHVSGPDLQCNGVGAGMYPNISQQNGLPSFPGGKKEREIIVIHMVGSPTFYGNYPPQLGYPDIYNKNGLYGNFPLQFGNFEPYFGFQGHGRLDGGAQIPSVTGSDLLDEHEDFVCYEKECYQGRKKNGLVLGSFQESTFLGGAQRDGHEALISCSSLKSRCTSRKHPSRNAGRLRSLYHNGRLVPIEEASAVPVPEKRITLLTKVSQPKLLTIKSLDVTGVREVAHAEYVVGPALSACGDEGKAPETFETNLVLEDGEVEKTVPSTGLKMTDEDRLLKEPELESKEVSVSTTTCNDKCLHCKVETAVLEGPALTVCQACKKTTACESTSSASQCCLTPTKDAPTESVDKSNSTDGCAVEVKHVIFDADSSILSTAKGQEDASLSSSTEAAAEDKQLDIMIFKKKSPTQNGWGGKGKQKLLGKKGVTEGKWNPKWPVGAAKVDFKVFAPIIRKAASRKNTSKTPVNECVSEASFSATCNEEDSMVNIGADSIRFSSQTETCKKHPEVLSPSPLTSSGDVPVNTSQDSVKEKPNGAACVDCIASEGRVEKKKGQNTGKTTLHKDCHDNVATVHDVESLVKTVFEDISNTEVQKQEPKGADSTNGKAWRPKVPTASQSKSATSVSGVQVSKAHVVPKRLELQGRKLHTISTFSAEKAAKEEQNVVQKSRSLSTSQLCNSEVSKPNKSQSFEARSITSVRGQQSLAFRKRSAEQADLGHQSSRDTSSNKEPIGSLATSSEGEFGLEYTKQSLDSTSSCKNNLVEVNCSVVASKYHMVLRRVYHVVEGSGGDYSIPSPTMSGKSHLTGNYRSPQTTNMQNQEELRKKIVLLSSGSSYTESEHSEEFSDSMSMVEIKSCRSESKGICHSGRAANQHTHISLVSSSGFEKSEAKKHVRPGERFSVWKPKGAPESGVLENVIRKKDDDKNGTLIPTHTEGASKEIKDSESSGQVSASSHLHGGGKYEKQTIQNVCGLPMELESVCYQPVEETDHAVNEEDTLPSIESEEVMDSQKKSEIVVSTEKVELTSVLKHVEEVLKSESLVPVSSCKDVVVQQSTQSGSEENTVGNHRPFFKKKNVMSYEKANRYHQMMFKKYKETGQWKPKSDLRAKC